MSAGRWCRSGRWCCRSPPWWLTTAVAVTEPSAALLPSTETGTPTARPPSPLVVTVALAGTCTVTAVPAKSVTTRVVPETDFTVPTTTGTPYAEVPDPAAPDGAAPAPAAPAPEPAAGTA